MAPIRQWVVKGGEAAEQHVVPHICSGTIGITAEEIDAFIHTMKTEATRELQDGPKADRPSPDECFMWRIGFEAAAVEAKIAFLNGLEAIDKATEGLLLLAAGLNASAEAFEQASNLLQPMPPRHALALSHRRLTPADFGCLPIPVAGKAATTLNPPARSALYERDDLIDDRAALCCVDAEPP